VNLSEVAEYCWKNRKRIDFGVLDGWDHSTFKKKWFEAQTEKNWIVGDKRSGWYWFELDLPLDEMKALERPITLTSGACDFGATSRNNSELFPNDLCHRKSNISVVYNGHEKNVLSRIRSHFSVANDGTGALGIFHYPLSHRKWHVSIFLQQHLENDATISSDDKALIRFLCNSKTGRTAIEQTWRALYGWPVLCKG
jgi:hypothetical protein